MLLLCLSICYYAGQASFWGTSLRDLNSLGVGVSLHFRILVYLGFFFLFATVLALPVFYFAFTGQRNPLDEMDPARFAILSVGNISPNAALANGTIPTPGLFTDGVTTRTLSLIITAYDFVLAVSFILFFIYLRWRIYSIAQKVDRILVTAGDYSVYVTGLPRDVTEDEVREHFNDRYDLYRGDWVFPSNFWHCYLGRKMFMRRKMTTDALLNLSVNDGVLEAIDGLDSKNASVTPSNGGLEKKQKGQDALRRRLYDEDVYPVLDATNTGKSEYLNQWVAEVTLTRANGRVIMAYQSQLKLIQRIRSARAAAKKYSEYNEWANEEKRVKALEQLAKLETRFDAVHKVARKLYDNSVVGAFVVFQNEESARRCLEDYHGSNSWLNFNGYWGQPPHLRFRRESILTVVEAPEPHQVIWENLQLTWKERIVRQMGVNTVVFIILFVSFLVIITAKAQQNNLLGYSPPAKLCNVVFPSIAFNVPFTADGKVETGFSLPDAYSLNVMSNVNGTCPSGQSRLYFTAEDGRPTQTSIRNPQPCLNECIDTRQTCTWPTSSGSNITVSTLMWQNCYCTAKAVASFRTGNIFQVWFDAQNTDGGWCQEFVRNYVIYNIFVVFAASSVLIINMMLRSVLASSSKWEGYWTTQDMQRASTIKVFVAMVVNTAGMVLLINAALPSPANTWSFGSFPLFNGKYTDFDSLWHANVGSSIVLTMCINIVSPHWYNVYYLVCKRAFCRFSRVNRETTQQQLNKRFEPVEFEVPTRTAVTLNTLWCCFMYASGQPLLLLVACVSFFFSLYIDKLTILRIARKPPMYDESVAMLFTQCIPIIVIIHLLIAIWTYSDLTVVYSRGAFLTAREVSNNNEVLGKLSNWLPTSTTDNSGLDVLDRVTRENTAPLAMLLIFLFVIWFLYAFFRDFIARALAFCCFIASRGRFCTTYGLQGAGGERFSGFQNNPAFTGPYKLAAKAPTAARNSVMLIDHRRVRSYTAYDVRGRLFRIYRWVSDGVAYGLPHVAGQRLLTWQVIAEMGMIPSYRIAANPLYAPAVAAMALGRRQMALEMKVAQGPHMPKMKRSSQITSNAIAMAASAEGAEDPGQSAMEAAVDAEYGVNSRNSLDERALFRAAAGGSISKAMAEAMRDVEELGFAGNAGAVMSNRAPETLKVSAEVALSEATRKAKERIGNGISPFKSIRSPALQHIASTRDMWQANAVARVPPPPPRPAATNTGIAAFKSVRASMQWVSGAVAKAPVAPPPAPTGGQITVDAGVLINPMAGVTERGEEEEGEEEVDEDDDATPRGDDTPTAAAPTSGTKPAPTPSPPASTVSDAPSIVVVASDAFVTPAVKSPPKKPLPVSIPKLDLSRGVNADHVMLIVTEGDAGNKAIKENTGPITTAGDPVALNSLGSITSTSVFTPLKAPGGKLPSWRNSGSRGDSRGDTDTEEPPAKDATTAKKMASSHSLGRMDATAGKDDAQSDNSDEGVSRKPSKSYQTRSSPAAMPPTPPLRLDAIPSKTLVACFRTLI
jgi:RNA recognition motif-containing protein